MSLQPDHEQMSLWAAESGQASVLLVLVFSGFLLATLGFGVDLSDMWFHRQAVQAAADAACLAGGEDMLAVQLKVTPPNSGFTVGTGGTCSAGSAVTMCKYAAFNGYSGAGLSSTSESNSVAWSFPSGSTLKVVIIENVKTYFMSVLGAKYEKVAASAICGLGAVLTAPPIVVLDPIHSGTLNTQGSPLVQIIGGPQRSIEVDSISTTAVTVTGNGGGVDTSKAGPNGTGGDVAVQGNEPTKPSPYLLGTTGHWIAPTLPFPDPFANVPAPTYTVGTDPTPATIAYQVHGCPDSNGCSEYVPGYYSAIDIKGNTAIFDPGIYVINGNFTLESGSVVRNGYPTSTVPFSTTQGVMFYLLNGAFKVVANSGKPSKTGTVDAVPVNLLSCDNTVPSGIPTTPLGGSVLNAECTDDGTYTGSGGTGTLSTTGRRGLLMFEAHSSTATPAYDSQGGGAFMLSGTEYFHTTTSVPGLINLQGNPSGKTYMLGYVITDQLSAAGNAQLGMVLSSKPTFSMQKVALFN